jgi:hypothetical protein
LLVSADDLELVQRSEDEEDYDLLTYNEVAARLGEVLAEEREQLARMQAAEPRDTAAIGAQQARIAQLAEGRERYEKQNITAEMFMERFGLTPRSRK